MVVGGLELSMFELRQAERVFVKRFPFMQALFDRGLLKAVFSDENSVEIVPTTTAMAIGEASIAYYRSNGTI